MKQSFLLLDSFLKKPHSMVIGYPKANSRQIKSRINELKKLGITKVKFEGQTQIGSLNILGKGYVGIVILAKRKTKLCALKIRRIDSQRTEMRREAGLLSTVNQIGVGPKLIASSKNFVVMEYLDGEKIGDWITNLNPKGNVKKLKLVIKKVLEDCHELDLNGFDHGELSSISKHVIVGSNITLIDFESSSMERRVSNVTSATQAFFIGSGISKKINQIYKIPRKNMIINSLRKYKKSPTRKNFDGLLKILKL